MTFYQKYQLSEQYCKDNLKYCRQLPFKLNMSDTNSNKENKEGSVSPNIKDGWMIRRCTVYDDEYSECTSIKGRFNQYFIFGKSLDCSQWKKDSLNCYKWVEENDVNAGKELVASEKARREQRLLPHYKNDVWEKRKSPPEDWNKPLPEHMLKEYENTYLNIKSKELRGEIPPSFDPSIKNCTIL